MIIEIQKIELANFKGINKLAVTMFGRDVRVFGDNGAGKTTIADAFHWCLFDKDSSGKSTFDIKPIKDGEPVHLLETSVNMLLLIDGEELALRKVFREKWITKRGDAESTFSGHETLYWVNDVPIKAGEYKAKIAEWIDETTFRRITSPDYFVSLNNKDMRRVLVDMVGEVKPNQVAGDDAGLRKIVHLMAEKRYTTDDLAKVVRGQITNANNEIKAIPARIDEVRRSIPAVEDWTEVEGKAAEVQSKIDEIERALVSARHAAQSSYEVQRKVISLKDQANDRIRALARDANEDYVKHTENMTIRDMAIVRLTNELDHLNRTMASERLIMAEREKTIKLLRDQYSVSQDERGKIQAEVWPGLGDDQTHCQTCGQGLPQGDIEILSDQAEEAFEASRARRLQQAAAEMDRIALSGQNLKKAIEKDKVELEALESKIKLVSEELKAERAILMKLSEMEITPKQPEDFSDDAEYLALIDEANRLQESLASPDGLTEQLITEKSSLMAELQGFNRVLARREQIEAGEKRVQELAERNRELADLVARYEGIRFDLERFMRKQAELLENRINTLFTYIQFRLFKTNINGGIEDDCEPMVNGVPYSTGASNSERIRAGLDIVRTMQRQADIFAPVIVDNAESATWLLPMECQVVQLVVSEADKELRIELGGEADAQPVQKRRADQVA